MRTGRHLASGATIVAVLLVSGCAPGGDGAAPSVPGYACVPRMSVSPVTASPGASITLMSKDVCDVAVPAGGWQVGAGSVGSGDHLVTALTTESFDGSFAVTITLPVDFPIGAAHAGVANWDYPPCLDNAGCPGASASFEVVG